ncbi:MAG: histidine triad nucleotide-binding protein [Peptococcaceae bacterium]|nr:histidine triad nucleotide-binding protein [Peptococcaceae bacterium]
MDDCIFCKIVRKEIPADVCYEDEHVIAFKDINPVAPVHILVVPKEHIVSLNEATPENADIFGHMAVVIKQVSCEAGVAESGYRVVINTGKDGGQVVHHIHAHVIGGRILGATIL